MSNEKNEETDEADRCQEDGSKVVNVHQILHFQSRLQHLDASNVTVAPSIVVRATTPAAKSPAIADGALGYDVSVQYGATPARGRYQTAITHTNAKGTMARPR